MGLDLFMKGKAPHDDGIFYYNKQSWFKYTPDPSDPSYVLNTESTWAKATTLRCRSTTSRASV